MHYGVIHESETVWLMVRVLTYYSILIRKFYESPGKKLATHMCTHGKQ